MEQNGPPGPLPLSPSRASDFKACPQLFKFRNVDRLPEPEDPYLAIGNLVHLTLERLLGRDPTDRTLELGRSLLIEIWDELTAPNGQPPLPFNEEEDRYLLERAGALLENYFLLEDPTSISAEELEWWVEHTSAEMHLRGIIDRVEVLPDGSWILTDYKTGASPSEQASYGSFFGLRFYALVCWRQFGRMPAELRLVHLRKPEVITLKPTEQMLAGLERQLGAVASAIKKAYRTDKWTPRPGPLCNWCSHRAICPAWQESAPADSERVAEQPVIRAS
jgi:putative RecB family exonuclease